MTFDQEQRPRRRGTFIVAAVFVVLIVIAAVVLGIVLAVRGHSSASPSTSPSAQPRSSSTAAQGQTTQGACGTVPYEKSNTLASAPATKWITWSATTLASSPTAGPSKNDDGYRSCYARTPEGALYAIYNDAQYCTDSMVLPIATEQMTANGPGKQIAVNQAKSASACEPSGQYVQGFKIASYDGTNVTLYLAIDVPGQASEAEVGEQLVWQDGDWKVVVDSQGDSPIATNQISSMAGFTKWGPNDG